VISEKRLLRSDNLRVAYALSKTRTAASNLGVTTAKLNASFRAARTTPALAKISWAVEDGDRGR
jgi:hypothetical protein